MQASRLEPELSSRYINLGLAYMGLKDYFKAIAAFKKACSLDRKNKKYKKLKKKMPKINSFFSNSQGSGKVIGYNLLEGKVVIETKEGKKIEVII